MRIWASFNRLDAWFLSCTPRSYAEIESSRPVLPDSICRTMCSSSAKACSKVRESTGVAVGAVAGFVMAQVRINKAFAKNFQNAPIIYTIFCVFSRESGRSSVFCIAYSLLTSLLIK